jgi:hypothetical protein
VVLHGLDDAAAAARQAQRRRKLDSAATGSEASQNMICAHLSIALLVGLLSNSLAG